MCPGLHRGICREKPVWIGLGDVVYAQLRLCLSKLSSHKASVSQGSGHIGQGRVLQGTHRLREDDPRLFVRGHTGRGRYNIEPFL